MAPGVDMNYAAAGRSILSPGHQFPTNTPAKVATQRRFMITEGSDTLEHVNSSVSMEAGQPTALL